jgi:hypothetical protein
MIALVVAGCGGTLYVVYPDDSDAPGTDSGDPDTAARAVDTGPARYAATPVAPTAGTPMWQGRQAAFLDADGAACHVPVAAGLGAGAFCWVAPDRDLWCAGQSYPQTFGSAFVDTGVHEVRQVHVSHPQQDGAGSGICALAGDALTCLAADNASGQLANGGTGPDATWTRWGDRDHLAGAATGTWDSFCAIGHDGATACAGDGFGAEPVDQGTHSSVVIDQAGAARFDDAERWRASAGMVECTVGPSGLTCVDTGHPWGTAGHVVDGGEYFGGDAPLTCWLEDDGRAWCATGVVIVPVFADQPVLMLLVDPYTDARCALRADGSIACSGDNTAGKLGTDAERLDVETVVAPPGTIDTRCH